MCHAACLYVDFVSSLCTQNGYAFNLHELFLHQEQVSKPLCVLFYNVHGSWLFAQLPTLSK